MSPELRRWLMAAFRAGNKLGQFHDALRYTGIARCEFDEFLHRHFADHDKIKSELGQLTGMEQFPSGLSPFPSTSIRDCLPPQFPLSEIERKVRWWLMSEDERYEHLKEVRARRECEERGQL